MVFPLSLCFADVASSSHMVPEDAKVPTVAPWTSCDIEVTSHSVIVRDGWYNMNMPTDLA